MNLIETDVSIIGGGPVGIFASFACGMLGLKSTIFEQNHELGGQCNALYPDKAIYDIPGIPKILAKDLISQLSIQSDQFKPTINLNSGISNISHSDEGITINNVRSKALIISAGFGACIPNKLAFENAAKYENKQIFYHVKDPSIFIGKKVVILGGGNSAADWAIHMCEIAEKVIMIHRRDAFSAFASSVEQFNHYIAKGKLVLFNSTTINSLLESDSLTLIGLEINSKTEGIKQIDLDHIIACYGMKSDLSALKNFNVEMSKDKILIDPLTQLTSLKQVYAVGDIAYSQTKTKLFSILSGFYECTIAANHIFQTLGGNLNKLSHSSDLL